MAFVTFKYMVERMPADELRRTFAAREHTLEYLVGEMRGQTRSKSIKSYFLFGPRGAGKTTLVRMLALRLDDDPDLRAAWLPVMLPEELHDVASLRDLLATVLRALAETGTPGAQDWHTRVEGEGDDVASRELAAQALVQITHSEGRRLVVFVENLDCLFADGRQIGLDRQERAALRRLLMAPDACLMLVGTAVRMFAELERYDEALFQYFLPVRLDRLDDEQVRQLLFRRAEFDGNRGFALQYQAYQGKVKALTRLTGGNPRLLLMLYETLAGGTVTSVMETLLVLIDSLTPLLKDVLEHQMTRQQAKVLDALMRAGGTAQPRDLVAPTRLSLNAVTTQLTRLRDMQLLDVQGGGRGRPAYYSAPDRLFSTWYQLRYLRPNRRRIELFVEFLRLWFDVDARYDMLRRVAAAGSGGAGPALRGNAPLAVEHVAAALAGTPYAQEAKDVAVRGWLAAGELDQAALALAEFDGVYGTVLNQHEATAYAGLGVWALGHADVPLALRAAEKAVARDPTNCQALLALGAAALSSGDSARAADCFDGILGTRAMDVAAAALARYGRGGCRLARGDTDGAIADFTAAMELPGAPADAVAPATLARGLCRAGCGNITGAVADFTAVIELREAPVGEAVRAVISRGVCRAVKGDVTGALADWETVARNPAAPAVFRFAAVVNGFMATAACQRLGEALALARQVQDGLDDAGRTRFVLDVVHALRGRHMRAHWSRICRALCEGQPPAVAEQLQFLLPVCDVLDSGDRGRLAPLPPEQRDFATEVLAGLEPPEPDARSMAELGTRTPAAPRP